MATQDNLIRNEKLSDAFEGTVFFAVREGVEPENDIPRCSGRQRWNERFRMSSMAPIQCSKFANLQEHSAHAAFVLDMRLE